MRTREPGVGWWRLYPWLPGILLAVGGALDFLTPPHVTLTPFLVAAPIAAAPLLSFWLTAFYGAVAVSLVGAEMLRITPTAPEAVIKVGTVASMAVFALLLNRMLSRRDERIASARRIAETVQRAVVPEPPERVGRLRVAARYQAAQRNALIGGDLYSVRETPYGVRMLVGDVRGKGLGATEVVAVLLGAFREAAEDEPELGEVAARMEATLLRERGDSPTLDAMEGFTTAVLVELPDDPPTRLRMINRGHPPPVLLHASGEAHYLYGDAALPLGLSELHAHRDQPTTATFPTGAHLLLYTDGLSEARDADGVFYDPAARLTDRRVGAPQELLDLVVDDVVAHSGGGLKDDLALLAVRHSASGD
ncbi:PP2C family protein-serine/threonine phosphatase [Streptomyces profundus]|uniref:PP2C family protein-serine/threonine phosphatase n=1 Tax=Streptomyces profundus TaxID=2867410 RepID=UPI002240E944|nr:PP2C family protein-serine/threonine phosphatase [Streptomyces sp. MA3_2.13]UED84959.1 serine/threonine-protein phosphatase [Streptomyces sp. MA3_2.13]